MQKKLLEIKIRIYRDGITNRYEMDANKLRHTSYKPTNLILGLIEELARQGLN